MEGRPGKPAHHLSNRRRQNISGCAIGIAACHSKHSGHYTRIDDLASQLVIARGDGISHQNMLNKLSDVDLSIIVDFLTVGIDPNAASDLFSILANRDHRLPAIIVSHSVPTYWIEALPDQIAADSTVNRHAGQARTLNVGEIDMRRLPSTKRRLRKATGRKRLGLRRDGLAELATSHAWPLPPPRNTSIN
ncbi:ATP-binding protein [Cryobacterium sp. Hb1]|uniref:ATP-binding protein n=1 Tax=Cryobacterium sp. Hb1 TaxID=1259147 RepID=UPI0018E09776|nr:ATP-binding protein [Cryobacterium sp. Hb1]